jgi:hypothetical protein
VLALAAALRTEGGGPVRAGRDGRHGTAALVAREDSLAMFPVLAGVALARLTRRLIAGGPEARTRWRRWAFLVDWQSHS